VAEIHPTAIVSPAATIAADVIVGPYAVIEGDHKKNSGHRDRPPSMAPPGLPCA